MLSCLFLEFWLADAWVQRRGNGCFIFINGGGAEGNRENVLFNDGSNCGLSIYFKLNLAIPHLFSFVCFRDRRLGSALWIKRSGRGGQCEF